MFIAGMMLGSREVLDVTTLPVSEEDMQILLMEPQGVARPTMEVVKRICGEMKIRRLKVGEKFTLPGGKVITVAADEIADDLAVLHVEGDPLPTRMGMARGQWWVNAGPIIAGRKAGQAALKKEAEAKATAKPKEEAK